MKDINISAGNLHKRIEIRIKTITQDEFGSEIETWDTKAYRWANIWYQTGKEKFQEDTDTSTQQALFKFRILQNLSVEDKILYKNDLWNIVSISPIYDDVQQVHAVRQIR